MLTDFLNCPLTFVIRARSTYTLQTIFLKNIKNKKCDVCVNQAENVLTTSGFAGIKASSKEILGNPN